MWKVVALAVSAVATFGGSPDPAVWNSLKWIDGPAEISLDGGCRLALSSGYLFLDGQGTKRLLTEFGNKLSGREIGFVTPQSRDWFVIVEHLDIGYVSVLGWEALDTEALLKNLQRTDENANAERSRNGWATVHVKGWGLRPRYRPSDHEIEWAIEAESGGSKVVNHTIGILGREGVVRFFLVDPNPSSEALGAFAELVRSVSFRPGHRYVDHEKGDRVAVGGLASVVLGGGRIAGGVDDVELPGIEVSSAESDPAPLAQGSSNATSGVSARVIVNFSMAAVAVGAAGFFLGRIGGRIKRHRRHRFALANRSGHAGQLASAAAQPGGISAASGASQAPPTDAGACRKRRFDAYSYHMAISRDLHWTINY